MEIRIILLFALLALMTWGLYRLAESLREPR